MVRRSGWKADGSRRVERARLVDEKIKGVATGVSGERDKL